MINQVYFDFVKFLFCFTLPKIIAQIISKGVKQPDILLEAEFQLTNPPMSRHESLRPEGHTRA